MIVPQLLWVNSCQLIIHSTATEQYNNHINFELYRLQINPGGITVADLEIFEGGFRFES